MPGDMPTGGSFRSPPDRQQNLARVPHARLWTATGPERGPSPVRLMDSGSAPQRRRSIAQIRGTASTGAASGSGACPRVPPRPPAPACRSDSITSISGVSKGRKRRFHRYRGVRNPVEASSPSSVRLAFIRFQFRVGDVRYCDPGGGDGGLGTGICFNPGSGTYGIGDTKSASRPLRATPSSILLLVFMDPRCTGVS